MCQRCIINDQFNFNYQSLQFSKSDRKKKVIARVGGAPTVPHSKSASSYCSQSLFSKWNLQVTRKPGTQNCLKFFNPMCSKHNWQVVKVNLVLGFKLLSLVKCCLPNQIHTRKWQSRSEDKYYMRKTGPCVFVKLLKTCISTKNQRVFQLLRLTFFL